MHLPLLKKKLSEVEKDRVVMSYNYFMRTVTIKLIIVAIATVIDLAASVVVMSLSGGLTTTKFDAGSNSSYSSLSNLGNLRIISEPNGIAIFLILIIQVIYWIFVVIYLKDIFSLNKELVQLEDEFKVRTVQAAMETNTTINKSDGAPQAHDSEDLEDI